MDEESTLIAHQACDNCGSSDANALYTDGHSYCFSCETYTKADGEVKPVEEVNTENVVFKPVVGEVQALNKRRLSFETCKKWDYQVSQFNGRMVQVANYKNDRGQTVAQKIRFPNKDFTFIGEPKKAGLFGQHLWRDGGKMVTIVEGELDALSVSQAFDNKWPVVSISRGAAGAKRDISKSIDWLEKFETVVFMFDNDEHGQKAAQDCAMLLTPGKAKLASLPLKDASDMVQAGRVKELIDAVWSAKVFRPDGIVAGADLWDLVSSEEVVESVSYPFFGLQEKTLGMRRGEIVTVTAGSGIGKSQLTREFAHHLIKQGHTVGYIALEESVKRSVLGLMAIEANKPLHLGEHDLTKKELQDVFDKLMDGNRVYFYDHWGSTDSDNLLAKIKYLVRGCGCDFIILDHLSIVVSGMGDGDERRLIDNTMTKLRTLTEELQCGMVLVSHLKRPSGDKGHEEGAVTTLAQLRGSAAIAQLSDMVIGLERNQQDPENKNLTTVRVLKNRWTGETGIACHLAYSKDTGRMTETMFDDDDQPEDVEF
jgi:twinkle protein